MLTISRKIIDCPVFTNKIRFAGFLSQFSVRSFPFLEPFFHFSSFFSLFLIFDPHLPIMPSKCPFPTPERIWKTHLSYKSSSLLYLPRIQKYLLGLCIPYNARIAIIDILVKEKKNRQSIK